MIDTVLEALAAGDGATALDRLLDAWRANRSPALANAVIALGDKLGDDTTLAIRDVCSGNASQALERTAVLERLPADPRMLAAIVAWIAAPPFHAMTSRPFWRLAFAILARDGDASLIASLTDAARGFATIKGVAMRSELQRRLALVEFIKPAGKVATRDAAALAAAITAFVPTATAPKPKRTDDEAALLAAIRAAPFDDAPRAVYADWLSERGDPRGEFIALQLESARRALSLDEAKRERVLLRKHAKLWVGEVARGFYAFGSLVSAELPRELDRSNSTYFSRGFLSRIALTHFTDAQLAKLAGHPTFETVEDISCGHTETATAIGARFVAFLAHPALRALSRVYVPADLALALADGPHAARIVELSTVRYRNDVAPVFAALAKLPALKRFRLVAVDPNADDSRLAAISRDQLGGRVTIDVVDWNKS